MKPNFEQMSRTELLAYLKQHRTDDEAWGVFLDRRSPDEKATWYPAPLDDEGIRIMEEALCQKIQEISSNRQPPTE